MSARVRPSTASAIISQRPATGGGSSGASIRMARGSSAAAGAPRNAVSKADLQQQQQNEAAAAAALTAAQQQLMKDPVAIQEETLRVEDRIRLLEMEGRSSYERTSQEQRGLREDINRYRTENKEMKTTLTNAKRGGGNVIDNEIRQLDTAICATTLKLDRLNDKCSDYKKKITDQESAMNEIEKNSRPVLVEGSALDKKIRALENRLDKSLIKYNEAVSIRKTYQQILKRLKEEQVGFDNQLSAIERTLGAKGHDYQELLSMSHQANAAKEAAKKELQDFQQAYAAERIAKDDQLAKKKAYVQQKADQTFKLERREKALRQKEAEAAKADMEEEQQTAALLNGGGAMARGGGRTNTDAYGGEDEERLAQYEAAFKTIKDATGVSDVNDLLQKYVNQEDTRRHLQASVHDSQSNIDRLQTEIDELTAKLEELRYSGSGQIGSRRIVEEFEVHLNETRHLTSTNGAKYESITKLLIAAKAGIEHLMEITQSYKNRAVAPSASSEGGGSASASAAAPSTMPDVAVVDDDTAVDALRMVEQKMMALLEEVVPSGSHFNASGGGGALTAGNTSGSGAVGAYGGGGGNASGGGDVSGGLAAIYELPAYNTRVKLPRPEDEYYSGADDDDGLAGDGMDDPSDDAVLKREQVKKISINAIQRETKKLKRRRK